MFPAGFFQSQLASDDGGEERDRISLYFLLFKAVPQAILVSLGTVGKEFGLPNPSLLDLSPNDGSG